MNNDFNFRPKTTEQSTPQTDNTTGNLADNSTVGQTEVQNTNATQPSFDSEARQDPTPPQRDSSIKKLPGKVRKFFGFLGLLLLVAAVAGGVWYWQQMQIKELQSSKSGLQSELSTLKAQIDAKEKAAPATSTTSTLKPSTVREIVTGKFVRQEMTNVTVEVLYLPGEVEEIWVEIGTKPGEMSGSTKHLTEGLGAGTAGQYARQEFGLLDVKPATKYFYWAGAKVDGKNVYGGVSSFDTAK